MTRQEAFNKTYIGLLTQNSLSQNASGDCSYRYLGKKCAIGFMIPDELYNLRIESLIPFCTQTEIYHNTGRDFPKDQKFLNDLMKTLGFTEDDKEFLDDLRRIHDFMPIGSWEFELKKVAKRYNLTVPEM